LTAHLDEEKAALQVRLDEAAAIAESYGVGATKRLVITRERALGLELASVAREYRAELIVVGSPVESRRGFRRAFPSEVFSVLREAPCRVMVATGPVAGRSRPAA
jgi:nucleotide-binding universal stress UspA family protein